MAQANDAPLIIRKVRKVSGRGHQGGAWKVAYADFVTAMMAFFLLLWLLSATTDTQKQGISDYFAPASVSTSTSGGGGVLGGKTIAEEGAMPSMAGMPGVTLGVPPVSYEDSEAEADDIPASKSGSELQGEALEEAAAAAEQREFERTAAALREAMNSSPALIQLADSLIIEQTPEGLRIQMVDQDKIAMFPSGSSKMNPRARQLLRQIADAIRLLPNKISVSGHTDGAPYATDRGYSNWELSSDRANASRRALIEFGIDESRITRVVGRADTDLLVPENRLSPRNRRISITLLREARK